MPCNGIKICFEGAFEIIPVLMHYQLHENVCRNILGYSYIFNRTVNEKYEIVMVLVHEIVKSTAIAIKKSAVAFRTVIHGLLRSVNSPFTH